MSAFKPSGPGRLNIYPGLILIFFFLLSFTFSFAQVWVQVPTPNPGPERNILRGISGTSSSDIWAVGYYEPVPGTTGLRNLILHWNGSTWQQFTTFNFSSTSNDLYDVEVVSPTDAWAAGLYANGSAATPQLLHWDGSSWTHVAIPNVPNTATIWSLDAIAPNDVWAVGGTYTNAYALHYNGSSWTPVTVPLVGLLRDELNAVHGLASNDVWAVGSYRNASGQYRLMARHWNGSTWTNSPMPASVSGLVGELLDVRMISSNDVWAIGSLLTGGIVKLHWNGSAWTEVTPPNGGGGALAPLSSNNIFSVGADISHWNGSSWTVVDPLSVQPYPALRNTYVAPNGDIWAAGRISEGTNLFKTLVYRTAVNTPAFSQGAIQTVAFIPNSSNNSIDALLLTADNDVSQVLTYSVVTPPAHGTLSGFPATAITNNGYAMPSGLSFTPTAGYAGPDQFVVRVSAGTLTAQTTINVSVSGTLPVTLKSFKAQHRNNDAVLTWETGSEKIVASFTIERSTDGRRFETIASIAPNNAAGLYHYTDKNIRLMQRAYYRLKINDADRHVTYSGIIALSNDAAESVVLLYPNPVQSQAKLMISTGSKQTVHYIISYADGRLAKTGSAALQEGSNTFSINVGALLPGHYILSIKGATIHQQLRFVKE